VVFLRILKVEGLIEKPGSYVLSNCKLRYISSSGEGSMEIYPDKGMPIEIWVKSNR